MRRRAVLTGGLLLLAGGAKARAGTRRWSVIRERSSIGLSLRALGMTRTGRFADWTSGEVRLDDDPANSAQGTIEVRAASLDMGEGVVTRRAIGPDFLDVQRFPLIRLRLTQVSRQDRTGELRAYADITLKGRTRPVWFDVIWAERPDGDRITGSFILDRVAFGVGDASGLNRLIGREVRVDVSLILRQLTP